MLGQGKRARPNNPSKEKVEEEEGKVEKGEGVQEREEKKPRIEGEREEGREVGKRQAKIGEFFKERSLPASGLQEEGQKPEDETWRWLPKLGRLVPAPGGKGRMPRKEARTLVVKSLGKNWKLAQNQEASFATSRKRMGELRGEAGVGLEREVRKLARLTRKSNRVGAE